jgi:hypothetical protein
MTIGIFFMKHAGPLEVVYVQPLLKAGLLHSLDKWSQQFSYVNISEVLEETTHDAHTLIASGISFGQP